jgi:hypothetical protein
MWLSRRFGVDERSVPCSAALEEQVAGPLEGDRRILSCTALCAPQFDERQCQIDPVPERLEPARRLGEERHGFRGVGRQEPVGGLEAGSRVGRSPEGETLARPRGLVRLATFGEQSDQVEYDPADPDRSSTDPATPRRATGARRPRRTVDTSASPEPDPRGRVAE